MLITAYKLMAKTSAKQLKELMELFTTTALEICEGQMFDMMFEQRESVTEAEYMEMIRLKTAVLLGCSLKTGAIVAQAPPADIQSLYNFGLYIGLAFQLQDDMLDVYGDPDVFGKNTGGDILCNKKTFPLIYALTHGDSKQQRELKRWLGMTDFNPEEKINSVLHIYNEVNVRDATQERISLYYRKAKEELSALTLRDERLTVLKNIADNLLQRNR
jgi:geranylgeranyl diphosphate synthase type II